MKLASLAPLVLLLLCACGQPARRASGPPIGDAKRGRALAEQHECYDCHLIPGIDRKPGPGIPTDLAGFARKEKILDGTLENTPENLIAYLQHPREVLPTGRMPGIGDRVDEAHDIAAFLMTLD